MMREKILHQKIVTDKGNISENVIHVLALFGMIFSAVFALGLALYGLAVICQP